MDAIRFQDKVHAPYMSFGFTPLIPHIDKDKLFTVQPNVDGIEPRCQAEGKSTQFRVLQACESSLREYKRIAWSGVQIA